jgi:inosine-uridine nucleoside N-ribohydrolase
MGAPQSVILDMDPRVDDALAIILAMRSPELNVLGLTTVSGNVPVELGTQNALKMLELVGREEVPVFEGASRLIEGEPIYAYHVHGQGGLGDAELPPPRAASRGDAGTYLHDTIVERGEELVIIATGPLTNLAHLEERQPGILKTVKEIVVMGGAIREPGNVTPTSEFNFHVDPVAARSVVASGAEIRLVPLDATRQVSLDSETLSSHVSSHPSEIARFCELACRPALSRGDSQRGSQRLVLHDPLAVGVAIDRTLCATESFWIDVEPQGELTAGQVVADFRVTGTSQRSGREVLCATRPDSKRFIELFLRRVFG